MDCGDSIQIILVVSIMLTKFLYVLLAYVVYAIIAIVTTVVFYKKNLSEFIRTFYTIISMLIIGLLLVIWAILLF